MLGGDGNIDLEKKVQSNQAQIIQDAYFYQEPQPVIAMKRNHNTRGNFESYELDCCNCKKSMCLKLYCECFRNGSYCKRECLCTDCRNLKEYENLRLKAVLKISARNPMAFKPKIDKLSNLVGSETVGAEKAIHTRGCNCKKSKCL